MINKIINWMKQLFKKEEAVNKEIPSRITVRKIIKEGGRFNKSRDLSQVQLCRRKKSRLRNKIARNSRKENG